MKMKHYEVAKDAPVSEHLGITKERAKELVDKANDDFRKWVKDRESGTAEFLCMITETCKNANEVGFIVREATVAMERKMYILLASKFKKYV